MKAENLKSEDYAKAIALPWWGVQVIAWALFCILSFLSLTLWYGDPQWMHLVHIALQAVTGALLTWPLARLLRYAGTGGIVRRILAHLLLVGATAFIWNIFRMATFEVMLSAPNIWEDFGGWYFTALLIFGFWAALYYIAKAYSQIAAQRADVEAEKLRRVEAESLSRDAQMKMLRYQLNPHFLFNTLNSISALVKTNRLDQSRKMISQLSHFLRLSLEKEGVTDISLQEELDTLKLYLDIEKVRYGNRLTTVFNVDEDTLDANIPALILQPLFENALQYAVAGQVKGGTLRLTAERRDDALVLSVSDSGRNDVQAAGIVADLKKGVGLQNTESRVKTHYPQRGAVTYGVSDLGGLQVTLKLPYVPILQNDVAI